MSDLAQVMTPIIGLLGTALTGYIAYKMAQLHNASEASKRAAEMAALRVEAVAINLKTANAETNAQLSKIEDTTKKTLVHVNDAFLIQLRLYAESTRVVAELRKRPEDIEKADAAEKMYREHEAKQNQARDDKNAIDLVKAKGGNSIL